MGLLSLVYGTKKQLQIAQIEVDVSVSETHETDCDVTENPVESGANITDHVQVKPARLTVEGLVSDTPIKFLQGVRDLFDDNRSRKTYEELLAIQTAREPIDVITGLKQYSNMILKTLTVPRNSDTGRSLRFTAQFQEVRIVDSASISIAVSDSQFQKKSTLGKTSTATPTSKVQQDAGSLLSRITGLRG
jgi:hypothetical protein